MKKVLSLLLILLLFLAVVLPARASSTIIGDWSYEENGDGATITGYRGPGGDVVVPSEINGLPVTRLIECYSISNRDLITSITVPEGVTSISGMCYRCANLRSVSLPESLTTIGRLTFEGCASLTEINIPKNVYAIGERAFFGCASLAGITFPEGLTSIEKKAFEGCVSLAGITLPASLRLIGEDAFAGCTALVSLPVIAKELPTIPNSGQNRDRNNYGTYGVPVYSYLFPEGEKMIRVDFTSGLVLIETYSMDFRLLSVRRLASDVTEIPGGFFAGSDAYYLITGRLNLSEDDSVAVVTVTKYDKEWNVLGRAELPGANTVEPFRSGSLRCAEFGGMLYVHTCHRMYKSRDGMCHQSNMSFCVRESDMTVTDVRCLVGGEGFVSHSFNQFILIDGEGRIVTYDQGDGNPRAAYLQHYQLPAGGDHFVGQRIRDGSAAVTIKAFPGEDLNQTGASLGGLAEIREDYVTAYNFVVSWDYDSRGMVSISDEFKRARDVYLSFTDKNDFTDGGTRTVRLTDYEEDGPCSAGTPVLVPLGEDGGWVLWNRMEKGETNYESTDTVCYARYYADGSVGEVMTATGALSDCQPAVVDGKAVWYVTGRRNLDENGNPLYYPEVIDTEPVFYVLDGEGNLTAHSAQWQKPEAIKVKVAGDYVWWTDAEPFIDENSRTLVPLRAVAEALGLEVRWNGEKRWATFTDGERTITFPIGGTVAYTESGDVAMDTAAVIVNDRTYAPVRYLAEHFGCTVSWDAATKTVLIGK